ncbi:MAG: nucleotidyl transferase AbiEii/AbiGii toxin family protein [Candidatus Thermoplasmatota archaeon]|nr:nucleotidyl transferase AbiEii/AbiGii toxin family protein [Candidatus Thermoplasmatota archaeon]
MVIDPDDIERISRKRGLGLKFVSKDMKISILLEAISAWEGLDFALKGGTAINRLYLKNDQRFSEDIDIDLFGPGRIDERLSRVRELFDDIQGFDIIGPRMLYHNARFDAIYTSEFGEKDRVMLDINIGYDRSYCVNPIERRPITSSIIAYPSAMVPVYSMEDLLAQKFMALENRIEGKDVYDIKMALNTKFDVGILKSSIIQRLEMMKMEKDLSSFLDSLMERRDLFLDNWVRIMNATNHYLPKDRRPDWRSFIRTLFDDIQDKVIGEIQ